LHANTVRAILQPDVFGWPHPTAPYTDRLAQFVSLAGERGLHVQLTLFDWWYSWWDRRGSQTWARELLTPYVGDPRIAFVELRNEMLPKPETTAWAAEMIPFLRRLLPATPVTISVAGRDPLKRLRALKRGLGDVRPDFFDLHFFGGGGETAYSVFAEARRIVAPTPLWIGETGYPTITAGSGFGGVPRMRAAQEAAQVEFLAATNWAARANGLASNGIWQLSDLVPAAVPDRVAGAEDPDLHYGLYRVDGTPKPATALVRAAFDGATPTDFNNGFEDSAGDVPARWEMAGDGMWFASDRTVAATGAASAELAGAGTGSYSLVPPNGGVRPGERVSASVWARRADPRSTVVALLEWHNRQGDLLRRDSSPTLAAVDAWTQLFLAATAPRRAAYVRIVLVAKRALSPVWFDDVAFRR
jgi:hypothetical protein